MEALTRFDLGMDGYMEPTENGEYCYASDAEKLQAEIAALKAPPKVLSVEEVSEAGGYWWRETLANDWETAYVYRGKDGLELATTLTDGVLGTVLFGQFIGPIKMREV